jgi:hypothetical protein
MKQAFPQIGGQSQTFLVRLSRSMSIFPFSTCKRTGAGPSSWLMTVFMVCLLVFLALGETRAEHEKEVDLGTVVTVRLTGNGTTGPYQLKDRLIFEETDWIEKNGRLLTRNQDYAFDYNRGRVMFVEPIYPTDTLEVGYKNINFNLRSRYFHRELVLSQNQVRESTLPIGANSGEGRVEKGRWSFLPRTGSSDLTLSGSKTFSFEVGSARDPSIKQGLWLSANGRATEDVEVSLQLSDQNMPATPDGTTKRLDELDQVHLQVTSSGFSGTLGDYNLQNSGSEFSSYRRKLKGLTTQASVGVTSFSFALASSGGEYCSNRFNGEDNKQGPYHLAGKNGETDITILAGTERVWVDGEEMQRGSGGDYTIDYSLGTVEFTPRRLITSDSRIAVDFEYSAENYQRDLYAGNLGGELLGGVIQLKASGILEKDDRNHPTGPELSATDKQILAEAGNDRFSAFKEGATFVGEGRGEYDLAYDSTGNPYYQYVGADSGSYQVNFSWMGTSQGSYRYQGKGIYRYVYPGHGDFSPVVLLPLPQSQSLFDINLSLIPTDALTTTIEWARSERDQNTLSNVNDERNQGNALAIKSAYQDSDFRFLKSEFHELRLEGEYRSTDSDFAPLGRINSVDRERIWGLDSDQVDGGERTYQLTGSIAPWRSFALDFDYGKLKQADSFASGRSSLGVRARPSSWISAEARTERISSVSRGAEGQSLHDLWTRNSALLSSRYKKLATTFSWRRERRSLSASEHVSSTDNFDGFTGQASYGLSTAIKVGTEFNYRHDVPADQDRAHSWVLTGRFSAQDWEGMLSSDVEFTRRVKKYENSDVPVSESDLLVTRFDFYPSSQLINVKFYHSQNQIHSASRVDNYLEVEEGKGDYVYEEGRYMPHPEGNFVLLSEWVGDGRPCLDLNKSVRLVFSPHKVSNKGDLFWRKVGKILSTDSFVNLRGRFEDDRSLGFYLLYPLFSVSDFGILQQNLLVRHDLNLIPTHRSLGIRLRWERDRETDGLTSEATRKERTDKEELQIKSRLSGRHFLELNVEREQIDEVRGGNLQSKIDGAAASVGFTRMQARSLELKVSAEHRQREEHVRDIGVRFYSCTPEVVWALLTQGRLRAKLGWTYLTSAAGSRSLPYVLTEGKTPGQNYNWRLLFDYKLSDHLVTNVAYSGESFSSTPTKHSANVEVKALF